MNMLDQIDKEDTESDSTEEEDIDEEKVLRDIMKIEGGKEFMSYIKTHRPIYL